MAKEVFGSKNSIGEVQIASDVVSAIAGISAADVDGVQAMAGGSINCRKTGDEKLFQRSPCDDCRR